MSALDLPFEILLEITSYLDKRALKAVRVAIPNSLFCYAAATDLFRSLALRLCTPLWSARHIRAKLLSLDRIYRDADARVNARRLFGVGPQVVRELVVDTRYPHNLSSGPWVGKNHNIPGVLPFYALELSAQDVALFVELVRRVVGLTSGLIKLRWRGSTRLSIPVYNALARIMCAPGRTYSLNVSLRWDVPFDEIEGYLAPLSGLKALGLESAGGFGMMSAAPRFTQRHAQAVIAAIKRSPELEGFSIHMNGQFVMDEHTTTMLWSAVFAAPELNTFMLEHPWINMRSIPFPAVPGKLNKLRNITLLLALGGAPAAGIIDKAVQDLNATQVRPRMFKSNVFSLGIGNWLLTDRTNYLTEVDIECHRSCGGTTGGQLGGLFWNEVVTRHAGTLRVIPLDMCTALEELTVTFVDIQEYISYIIEMLERLLPRLQQLAIVNLAFSTHTPRHLLELTTAKLVGWLSLDMRLQGREIQVRYRTRDDWEVSPYCSLRGRHGPVGAPVLFDDMIQTWEMQTRRAPTGAPSDGSFVMGPVFGFERLDDSYIFDDDNI
ncbi:hypothetical protein ABW21_db0207336 [Orbilia brochopaga]|nr:hypothetical protein ABW21_db0207336 [Drechslerella brochopaga]